MISQVSQQSAVLGQSPCRSLIDVGDRLVETTLTPLETIYYVRIYFSPLVWKINLTQSQILYVVEKFKRTSQHGKGTETLDSFYIVEIIPPQLHTSTNLLNCRLAESLGHEEAQDYPYEDSSDSQKKPLRAVSFLNLTQIFSLCQLIGLEREGDMHKKQHFHKT